MNRALLLALVIPAVFLFLTGLIKSLVRHEFTWSSFYLGLDISLAALANRVVNLVNLGHQATTGTDKQKLGEAAMSSAEYLVFALGMLLFTMIIHQRWEASMLNPTMDPKLAGPKNRIRRGIWLGIVSNLLGTGSLIVFIFMKLKGDL